MCPENKPIVVIVEDGDKNSNFKIVKNAIPHSYTVLPIDDDQQAFRTAVPVYLADRDSITKEHVEKITQIVDQCNAFFALDYQLTPGTNPIEIALANAEQFYYACIEPNSALKKLPILFYSSQKTEIELKLNKFRKKLADQNIKTEFASINYETEEEKVTELRNAVQRLLADTTCELIVKGGIRGDGTYAPNTEVKIVFDNDGEKEFIKWEITEGTGSFKDNSENNETATFIMSNSNVVITASYNTTSEDNPPITNES